MHDWMNWLGIVAATVGVIVAILVAAGLVWMLVEDLMDL